MSLTIKESPFLRDAKDGFQREVESLQNGLLDLSQCVNRLSELMTARGQEGADDKVSWGEVKACCVPSSLGFRKFREARAGLQRRFEVLKATREGTVALRTLSRPLDAVDSHYAQLEFRYASAYVDALSLEWQGLRATLSQSIAAWPEDQGLVLDCLSKMEAWVTHASIQQRGDLVGELAEALGDFLDRFESYLKGRCAPEVLGHRNQSLSLWRQQLDAGKNGVAARIHFHRLAQDLLKQEGQASVKGILGVVAALRLVSKERLDYWEQLIRQSCGKVKAFAGDQERVLMNLLPLGTKGDSTMEYDGNDLFRALNQQLGSKRIGIRTCRRRICDRMVAHSDRYRMFLRQNGELEEELLGRIAALRQSGTTDTLAFQAFADLWERPVVVYTQDSRAGARRVVIYHPDKLDTELRPCLIEATADNGGYQSRRLAPGGRPQPTEYS